MINKATQVLFLNLSLRFPTRLFVAGILSREIPGRWPMAQGPFSGSTAAWLHSLLESRPDLHAMFQLAQPYLPFAYFLSSDVPPNEIFVLLIPSATCSSQDWHLFYLRCPDVSVTLCNKHSMLTTCPKSQAVFIVLCFYLKHQYFFKPACSHLPYMSSIFHEDHWALPACPQIHFCSCLKGHFPVNPVWLPSWRSPQKCFFLLWVFDQAVLQSHKSHYCPFHRGDTLPLFILTFNKW